jgi:hypothetical protein
MRISELDDIEKEALLGSVVDRARADLNEGKLLTEMRAGEEHTPDEGEPHPATECESRGCVKLKRSER